MIHHWKYVYVYAGYVGYLVIILLALVAQSYLSEGSI